jgi:hypothetical protein
LNAIRRFRGHRARSSRFVYGSALAVSIALALFAAPAFAAEPTPTVDSTVTDVGYTSAHVSGTVDPEGGGDSEAFSRTGWNFQVSTEPSDPASFQYNAGAQGALSEEQSEGTTPIPVEGTLQGLEPGRHYAVRLIATNDPFAPFGGGTASGPPYPEFTTPDTAPPAATIAEVTAVTATTALFSGTIDPEGTDPAFDVNWHFECTPACPEVAGGQIPADSDPHQVSAEATGLEPNTTYEVRLVAANAGEQQEAGPITFQTAAVSPAAETVPAFALPSGSEAILGGNVNAFNSATTSWFEFGTDESYGKTIPAGDSDSGQYDFVTAEVDGLAPATRYHYRFVAQSAGGITNGVDLSFETPPATAAATVCPNEQFRVGRASRLPDCRGLEMVSPPFKNNADAYPGNVMASANGDKISWPSTGSFAGQPTARVFLSAYLSERGPDGWSTRGIAPPGGRFTNGGGYYGFKEDLSKGTLVFRDSFESPLLPGVPGGNHLYMRDLISGDYQLLSGTRGPLAFFNGAYASADFNQFVFQSFTGLTADSPCDTDESSPCAYEWDEGELRLVSIDPDGNPIKVALGRNFDNVISDDGRRVYFSKAFENKTVYLREDATVTIDASSSERTLPGGVSGANVEFLGAEAAHGAHALLLTGNTLVDEDTNEATDLYMFDAEAPEGERLTLLSEDLEPADSNGAGVLGVVTRSEDLSRVLFAATGQIVPGAPKIAGPKLYEWNAVEGSPSVRYVGPLSEGDSQAWAVTTVDKNESKPTNVSPDGRYMTFLSEARMTAFDNAGQKEVYLYDASTRELRCVSCSFDRFPSAGFVGYDSTGLIGATGVQVMDHRLRNLADGGRLFFETAKGLVPGDSNGKIDVYEYEGGRLHLISSGSGRDDAIFLDASTNGDAVFFNTKQQLVGWDTDQNRDVYVASVGGGLPEPLPTPPACEGDACQPPPVTPEDPTPASSGFKGPESPRPQFKKNRRKHHPKHRHHKKHKKHGKKKQSTRGHA